MHTYKLYKIICLCGTYLEALGDINLDLLLLCPLEDLPKHDVCNLLNLTLGQLSEDNDLIQPAARTQQCKLGHGRWLS